MSDPRPASIPLKPRILPAPDENIDPIDTARTAAPTVSSISSAPVPPIVPPDSDTAAPAQFGSPEVATPSNRANDAERFTAAGDGRTRRTAARPKREREVTVQLATRVSPQTRDYLDQIVERDGLTLRQALEMAIRECATRP